MLRIDLYLFTTWCISLSIATIDLNVRHLEYVADHLSPRECYKLIILLHKKSFQVNAEQTKVPKTNAPCLVRLLKWDTKQAGKNTFQKLCIRLREMGYEEVAVKLSKSVYHNTASAIIKNFLADPFKAMLPKKSAFLEEKVPEKKDEDEGDGSFAVIPPKTDLFVASVLCVMVSLALTTCVGFYVCCPGMREMLCVKCCPIRLVLCYEKCVDTVFHGCKRFVYNGKKHVIGIEKIREEHIYV